MVKWRAFRRRLGAVTPRRSEGDAARDRRDWKAAADHYRAHLAEQPDDHAIRVQLGHMLKEAGSHQGALAEYDRVRAATPDDADLLLNIGHLMKLMGDRSAAEVHYRASLALDGNPAARDELGRMLAHVPSAHVPDAAAPAGQRALLDGLVARTQGLLPIAASGINAEPGGVLTGTGDDPWIEFELAPSAFGDTRLGELAIDLDLPPGAPSLRGHVYLDYGAGFEERRVIPLDTDGEPLRLLVAMPALVRRLRWDPDIRPSSFVLRRIAFVPAPSRGEAEAALRAHSPTPVHVDAIPDVLDRLFDTVPDPAAATAVQRQLPPHFDPGHLYDYWRRQFVDPTPDDYRRIAAMTQEMAVRPRFSFVMPVYNPPVALLRDCIEAMLGQTWPDIELCIADDASPDPAIGPLLREYAARDARVKLVTRPRNGHISAASNSALALASGDFIVLVDHDDLVPDYALFVVAYWINRFPDADILFSDEDKIDVDGNRHSPYFKGNFNKFLMFGHNMVSHLGVYRRTLVEALGGFRQGLEGSQDYDLFLRCCERTDEARIIHIPHVLYHWRTVAGSTAISHDQKSYAVIAAEAAINGHFERTGTPLRSRPGYAPGLCAIGQVAERDAAVTVIVPTRDQVALLAPCVASVLAASDGRFEVLVFDNGSTDPATLDWLARAGDDQRVRVVRDDMPFNFSALNNRAARAATGEILCFLNNDTEVESAGWLARARALLALDEVGVVGARLFYPDGHLQHFGIATGMMDHRVAGSPHLGLPRGAHGYFGKAGLIQEFSAVTAACMFVRREQFLALGGFGEELAVAYNDVDLCLRYRRHGLRVLCDPEIALIHKESRSRGSDADGANRARLDREAALMRERWGATLDCDPFWSPNHALDRPDFALAYPPRVPMPWRV